ncbi:methionine--tRNA ligase [Campylobacter troglodytis]|uniref:methionine--tRNA ligase n=1 Tax=Campylobacter troglodytis TaxID=654363 RepID=UPI001159EC9F|nr:methionine--tRNA ligase [Campylobacter troglodytis]TQR60232.1 methionine--tRNA ligase [Campylobacter troglodytis]
MRYLTTPIYYVNDVPHLGHAYTTIIADTMARFYRLQGEETLLLTGTDEHGQKIEQAAKTRGYTSKKYADEISAKFKALWDDFGISYDIYARTTDARHIAAVQAIFTAMYEKGDIYKGEYEGYYCISCESFFTKTQLVSDKQCPDCGKETNLLKEESYFFRLSRYEDKILKWYEDCDPILPKNKKQELVNFVRTGLKDLSITRTGFDWGIALPKSLNDDKHIIYVWLDALFIYLSSLDYISKGANTRFFPAHLHLVGKDILKFHAIYWPAFLMSVGLPLPKHIAAHGWWTRDGEKMSKSKGNVIKPKELADAYGLEAFRYFILREVPFGNDGDFSEKAMMSRINSELCNELGNLQSRLIGMAAKYSNSTINSSKVCEFFGVELAECKEFLSNALNFLEILQTNRYLEELFKALSLANSSISKYEPWGLIKKGEIDKANALVALCANILARVALLLSPVLPKSCAKIAENLGFDLNTQNYKRLILGDELINFKAKAACDPLFVRVEKPLLKTNNEILGENRQKNSQNKGVIANETKPSVAIHENSVNLAQKSEKIKIDDFKKITIQIATVKHCERVEGSEKLLKFILELENGEQRQVLSGIAKFYEPQSLINKQVCVLTNLKKAKIFGIESDGMILSAKSGDKIVLISPQELVESGSFVG